MKSSIRISDHVSPDFRYNLLMVCGDNGCKIFIKDNLEMRVNGPSVNVKDNTQHVRLKMDQPKEYSTTTVRCTFEDMRHPFLNLIF